MSEGARKLAESALALSGRHVHIDGGHLARALLAALDRAHAAEQERDIAREEAANYLNRLLAERAERDALREYVETLRRTLRLIASPGTGNPDARYKRASRFARDALALSPPDGR